MAQVTTSVAPTEPERTVDETSHEPPHFRFWPKHLARELHYPRTSIDHNLTVSAARYPDRPFIIFYGHVVTWQAANAEVDRIAAYLQQRCGVTRGDRVILYMQNCPQFILAYYAVLRAGGVVVPVNPMNLSDEIAHYVSDSGAKVAFFAQELAPHIVPHLSGDAIAHAVAVTYSDCWARSEEGVPIPDAVRMPRQASMPHGITAWHDMQASDAFMHVDVGPDDLAVLPYTSGSTGQPKGCMHTHATTMASSINCGNWESVSPESVLLVIAPLCHITGMQFGMNRAVYAGATIVLMQRWDAAIGARLIEQYRCTHWNGVPLMAVDLMASPEASTRDLRSLRAASGGGAAMPAVKAQEFTERFGLDFVEGYGLTEAMSQTHGNVVGRAKLQCMGMPIFGMESIVVDPVTLRAMPQGEVGEVLLRGPVVFKGYWRNDEATEQAFVEAEGRRWFRTGDLGRIDEDGYFFFTDRLKRMINASGYKVWPSEVETIMYRHPSVRECCVIAAPDARRGETVKAVVVLRPDAPDASAQDVLAWAQTKMASYKTPKLIEVVAELPRGSSGKIDWRTLQEREMRASAD